MSQSSEVSGLRPSNEFEATCPEVHLRGLRDHPQCTSVRSACWTVLLLGARKALAVAPLAVLALGTPAWAHDAEELGHHWEIPAYRIEMLTQLAIMAGVAMAVFGGLSIRNALRRRRARQ